jgi:hypothetical protein
VTEPAVLVAREIQDLTTSVGEVADAIRKQESQFTVNVPEAPPPNVVVNVPEAAPPSVVVNVPEQQAPVVNVAAAEVAFSPKIVLPQSMPNSYEVEVTERDGNGYIRKFVITPQ